MLTELGRQHLAAVAALHCGSLPGDFLPSLGPRFLEVLYGAMLELGVAFGSVALDGEAVIGFSLGTLDSGGLFKQVLRRRTLPLSLEVVRALLRQPRLLLPILETVLYPVKEVSVGSPKAELLVIAVEERRRGTGVGGRLVSQLEAGLGRCGASAYKVTVLERNRAAHGFYERAGFVQRPGFRLYGKDWRVYEKRLASAARDAAQSRPGAV